MGGGDARVPWTLPGLSSVGSRRAPRLEFHERTVDPRFACWAAFECANSRSTISNRQEVLSKSSAEKVLKTADFADSYPVRCREAG